MDSPEFSGIWPKWGSMQSGAVFELERLEPATDGNAYSSWPTVLRSDAEMVKQNGPGSPSLGAVAMAWPTATAQNMNETESLEGWEKRRALVGKQTGASKPSMPLGLMAKKWATCRAVEGEGVLYQMEGKERREARPTLAGQSQLFHRGLPTGKDGAKFLTKGPTSHRLSPRFTEWLMGYPIGWTEPWGIGTRDSEPLETQLCLCKGPTPCANSSAASSLEAHA